MGRYAIQSQSCYVACRKSFISHSIVVDIEASCPHIFAAPPVRLHPSGFVLVLRNILTLAVQASTICLRHVYHAFTFSISTFSFCTSDRCKNWFLKEEEKHFQTTEVNSKMRQGKTLKFSLPHHIGWVFSFFDFQNRGHRFLNRNIFH